MGQSIPVFLVRIVGLLLGGLLLFAMFQPARAQRFDDYGLTPVGAATDFTPATATLPRTAAASANNGYNAAPVNGGYVPPNGATPSNYGYSPAPSSLSVPVAANGMYAAPMGAPVNAPQAQYQPQYQPAPQAMAVTPPAQYAAAASQPPRPLGEPTEYGYKPLPPTQANANGYVAAPRGAYYPAAAAPGGSPDYLLGVGDKLKLTVFEEADLSGDYTIDSSGFIRMPLVGQLRAAGYTAHQLEGVIGSALAQGYLKSPRISVEVSAYRPFYIIGAVTRPGQYPYVNHMNALNAIAMAGGFTPAAVESKVYVRREGTNREVRMPTDRSTPIYPGDVVRVDSTVFAEAMQLLNPLSTPLSIAAAAAIP